MGNILDGKFVSGQILSWVRGRVDFHISEEKMGYRIPAPSLAVVLVGDNPASESYVRGKLKACERAGINYNLIRFDSNIQTIDLLEEVKRLNKSSFDGFIVQLPLPPHIKTESIVNEISAYKDIDGFHPLNFGRMCLGMKSMRPATPYGIVKLLEYYDIETEGKHVVVIGKSNIVGKPISVMLGNDFKIGRATVTSCDIHTPKDLLLNLTRGADILIVAAGRPGLITGEMVKENSVVIDVGINQDGSGKIVGDCDFESLEGKVRWITPVPGGVGPMTIAGLILNTYESWKMKNFIQEEETFPGFKSKII